MAVGPHLAVIGFLLKHIECVAALMDVDSAIRKRFRHGHLTSRHQINNKGFDTPQQLHKLLPVVETLQIAVSLSSY